MEATEKCYKCGTEIHIDHIDRIARSEECPKCFAAVRSCMMCNFHDPKSYNECREPMADRITDKEKANFCDFYKFGPNANPAAAKQDALAAANALFKK